MLKATHYKLSLESPKKREATKKFLAELQQSLLSKYGYPDGTPYSVEPLHEALEIIVTKDDKTEYRYLIRTAHGRWSYANSVPVDHLLHLFLSETLGRGLAARMTWTHPDDFNTDVNFTQVPVTKFLETLYLFSCMLH